MPSPNIIVIYTDDQPANTIWQMGMLNMWASLIKLGSTFLNSFTVASQCTPSRGALLTGQYPHNNGLWSNASPAPNDYANFDETTLFPVALRNAFYKTGLFGKYINAYNLTTVPPGWDEWRALKGAQSYYNYSLNENGSVVAYGTGDANNFTPVIAGKAATWIAERVAANQPFFAWVGFDAPHTPPEPLSTHLGMAGTLPYPRMPGWNCVPVDPNKPEYMRDLPAFGTLVGTGTYIENTYRLMQETLLDVGEGLGTIITALGAAIDNTYIIFTSDNGYMLGEHRFPAGKIVPYDPSIRVPLVIRGPGVLPQMTRPEIVSNLDITATILEIAGATSLRTLDGKSLVPLLGSTDIIDDFREHLLIEFMIDHTIAWPIAGGPSITIPAFAGVRSHQWKYVKYTDTGETELYDMQCDPNEINSRQNDPNYAAVKAALDAILTPLKTCVGTACQA